jgi:hypothetical protein
LTQDQGIAATVAGSSCKPQDLSYLDDGSAINNCTVVVVTKVNATYTQTESRECATIFREDIPGSNLYFCVWGSLLAAVSITLRWKAAQALQFAQAAQRQATSESTTMPSSDGQEEVEVEDDDDAI